MKCDYSVRLSPRKLAKHMAFTLFWYELSKFDVDMDIEEVPWQTIVTACELPSTSIFMLPELQDHLEFSFAPSYCIVVYKSQYITNCVKELCQSALDADIDQLFSTLNKIEKLSSNHKQKQTN